MVWFFVGGGGGRALGQSARALAAQIASPQRETQPLEGLERTCQSVPERFAAAAAKRGRQRS